MGNGNYLPRAITFSLGGAVIVTAVAMYFASVARTGDRPQPRVIEVGCLKVDGGPTLHFDRGLLKSNNNVVGTYRFLAAVGGKHGPMIEIEGTSVRQAGTAIQVLPGTEGWFWRYLNDNTVEIPFYPQNLTLAHRCAA